MRAFIRWGGTNPSPSALSMVLLSSSSSAITSSSSSSYDSSSSSSSSSSYDDSDSSSSSLSSSSKSSSCNNKIDNSCGVIRPETTIRATSEDNAFFGSGTGRLCGGSNTLGDGNGVDTAQSVCGSLGPHLDRVRSGKN